MRRGGDNERRRLFTRRAFVLGGGQLALFSAIVGRLYYLQVVEADQYRTQSEDNRFNIEVLPPVRGRIFDRKGVALADNIDRFRIDLVAERAGDITAALSVLRRLVDIPDREIRRIHAEIGRKREFVPVTVAGDLSRRDISRIAVNMPYLPGLQIEVDRTRHYPFGSRAVHVTGYVAAVSEAELTGDPVLELPDFRIGKSGIEKHYETVLRGIAGQRQVEVNAHGRIVRKLSGQEAAPGDDLNLTIDIELQQMAVARLARGRSERVPITDLRVRRAIAAGATPPGGAIDAGMVNLDVKGRIVPPESGAAVVMDIHRGDILVMASTPGFDPNLFSEGLSPADWNAMLSNPRSPMTNKVISGEYSPGSTFKMLVCLAALEAGIASSSTRIACRGRIEFGKATFHCWRRHGHGAISMAGALEQSCDVYMYELARQLGIGRIAGIAARFGFGRKPGIDLPGERGGLVPTPEWKQSIRGGPWRAGETLITGIGQGFLRCTPLQLATMTARLANGGQAVRPRIARDRAVERSPMPGLRQHHLNVVLDGMKRAVNGHLGTARDARVDDDRFRFAGKTGSVQVKRITAAEREAGIVDNDDRPWRDRDHAMFVAYAPMRAPRYAIAVVIEHGGSGGKAAAPVARDILLETMRRDPSTTTSRRS